MASCGRCLVMVNNVGNSGLAKKLINSGSTQKNVKSENVKNYEKSDHKILPVLWLPQKQALPPVAASGLTAPNFTTSLQSIDNQINIMHVEWTCTYLQPTKPRISESCTPCDEKAINICAIN